MENNDKQHTIVLFDQLRQYIKDYQHHFQHKQLVLPMTMNRLVFVDLLNFHLMLLLNHRLRGIIAEIIEKKNIIKFYDLDFKRKFGPEFQNTN